MSSEDQHKSEECPICRLRKDQLQKLVPCGHRLCEACIAKLEQFASGGAARRCPFCRQDFVALSSPLGLVQLCLRKMLWRLPKPDHLKKIPPHLRKTILNKLRNGRFLYGDTLFALLGDLSLNTLRLCDATNMTSSDLQRVVPLLARAPTKVILTNVPMLNDSGLRAVLQLAAPVLEHLNTDSASENLDGSSLKDFAEHMPHLERLELANCTGVDPVAFSVVVIGVSSTLKVVDASGCRRLGNDAILSLADCLQLQRLTMRGLWKLETPPLLSILEACKQLCALDVTHCRKLLGPELLRGVAAFCTNLRELAAGALANVQDEDVIYLALSTAGSALESWNLAGSQITDNALVAIRKHCPVLQRLDLSDCHEITQSGLIRTVTDMSQLRICQTSYCRNIPTQFQLLVAQLLAGRTFGIEDASRQKAATAAATMGSSTGNDSKPLHKVSSSSTLWEHGQANTTIGFGNSSASSSSSQAAASPLHNRTGSARSCRTSTTLTGAASSSLSHGSQLVVSPPDGSAASPHSYQGTALNSGSQLVNSAPESPSGPSRAYKSSFALSCAASASLSSGSQLVALPPDGPSTSPHSRMSSAGAAASSPSFGSQSVSSPLESASVSTCSRITSIAMAGAASSSLSSGSKLHAEHQESPVASSSTCKSSADTTSDRPASTLLASSLLQKRASGEIDYDARGEVTGSLQQAADTICRKVKSQSESRTSSTSRSLFPASASKAMISTPTGRGARVFSHQAAKKTMGSTKKADKQTVGKSREQ